MLYSAYHYTVNLMYFFAKIIKSMSMQYCDFGTTKSKIPDFVASLECKFDVLFPKLQNICPIYYLWILAQS